MVEAVTSDKKITYDVESVRKGLWHERSVLRALGDSQQEYGSLKAALRRAFVASDELRYRLNASWGKEVTQAELTVYRQASLKTAHYAHPIPKS